MILKRIYYWLHRKLSKPEEREACSGGYWQGRIRQETLMLCRGIRGRILEVGCGEGLFLTQLAVQNSELEIWGVDNKSLILGQAEKRIKEANFKNINLSQQDGANLSFDDEYFNAVVCINVLLNLDYIDFVRQVLGQIKRVCKKSGKIFFDFRNSANLPLILIYKLAPLYDATIKNQHLKTYHLKQIERILQDLNFDIVNKRYIGFPLKRFAPIIIIEAEKRC